MSTPQARSDLRAGSEPPVHTSVKPWLYWLLLPLHRLFLSLFFGSIVIEGSKHLPTQGAMVLAPKHYSRWDPVVLALLSVEPLWFMTNANQFSGWQGWLLPRLGAFPVDVNHPKIASFRYAIALLKRGKKLMLFPEGGIVRDQPVRPLKPGLARLVLQAEALSSEPLHIPIVPIAIHYEPTPVWRSHITITISPPLYAADYQQSSDKETAQAITEALEKALFKSLKKVRA
ncbi:lysophospholipid acyltransferase family protein [Stenomitos frigidus]|uniref:1-acyl-sn-glycerol-3-phosphate acyltransferase n=1 Tax=Stenomitos frigidus ULC18 TaxID=2107698 RepID=A0A2T1DTM4_9CYAN|nr:lysophospholipid acyltransferase family protein [Stenomitos frigidus]PSB23853.1 1-acyl-sn-glycerol-3-phosphate acyltransferase [Stenomitos frigidus ULC18]